MSCRQCRDQLTDLVDDRIGTADRVRVESHLADCATCRHEFEGLKVLIVELGEMPRAALPAGLVDGIKSTWRTQHVTDATDVADEISESRGLWRRLGPWRIAASFLALAFFGYTIYRERTPEILTERSDVAALESEGVVRRDDREGENRDAEDRASRLRPSFAPGVPSRKRENRNDGGEAFSTGEDRDAEVEESVDKFEFDADLATGSKDDDATVAASETKPDPIRVLAVTSEVGGERAQATLRSRIRSLYQKDAPDVGSAPSDTWGASLDATTAREATELLRRERLALVDGKIAASGLIERAESGRVRSRPAGGMRKSASPGGSRGGGSGATTSSSPSKNGAGGKSSPTSPKKSTKQTKRHRVGDNSSLAYFAAGDDVLATVRLVAGRLGGVIAERQVRPFTASKDDRTTSSTDSKSADKSKTPRAMTVSVSLKRDAIERFVADLERRGVALRLFGAPAPRARRGPVAPRELRVEADSFPAPRESQRVINPEITAEEADTVTIHVIVVPRKA